MIDVKRLKRLQFDSVPVYVDPAKPDWFVPSSTSDLILRALGEGSMNPSDIARELAGSCRQDVENIQAGISLLASRIDNDGAGKLYRGRTEEATSGALTEVWFHLTNRCNMSCAHCLFCSDGSESPQIDRTLLDREIGALYDQGCRTFFFTGGEPFLYPDFTDVVDSILAKPDTIVVVLTNGSLVKCYGSWVEGHRSGRLRLQISVDGMEKKHDWVRGKGAFETLSENLEYLRELGLPVTLAMTVSQSNVEEMRQLPELASRYGVENVHFLWLFKKGRTREGAVPPARKVAAELIGAYEKGIECGVRVDNVEILREQVFSAPGTRYDLSNAGWESLAVGPDGRVYPSPALIGEDALVCGAMAEGVLNVWQTSELLDKLRRASLIDAPNVAQDPLAFLTGGGDIDHSYVATGSFTGGDPWYPVYRQVVLYLIASEAKQYGAEAPGAIRTRMGERLINCTEGVGSVRFTRSNCVLIKGSDERKPVNEFYSKAAKKANKDILNPVSYGESEIEHIPEQGRVRSYGCGSPVMDCGVSEGEVLVDLGSGMGVECFIAAKAVGPSGQVFGIDMSDSMLEEARKNARQVAENLGYANVEFRKGFLESIPLPDNSVDVVISNCVVNLSPDKRRTFSEIFRILKPNGRIYISDITTDEPVPVEIQYTEKLRGECIGGALHMPNLKGMLFDLSFEAFYLHKRFLYRVVKEHDFYSTTYSALKPGRTQRKTLMYRGPFESIIGPGGIVFHSGIKQEVDIAAGTVIDETLFELDDSGNVVNLDLSTTCDCCSSPPSSSNQR